MEGEGVVQEGLRPEAGMSGRMGVIVVNIDLDPENGQGCVASTQY